MLSEEVLCKISNGEISSRRQLYKLKGRSKSLRKWLDSKELLMPYKWSKERVKNHLLDFYDKNGRLPLASDNWNVTARAQRYYGGWNNALSEVFGELNQNRYSELTDRELLDTVHSFVKKYGRIPLRSEFDGESVETPYWESFKRIEGISKWSDVFRYIDLADIKYYHDKKHGTGRVVVYNDVVYLSNQEYLIGRYLTDNGINFEKEVPYDNSNHVFDFYLVDYDVYIEYYGLATKEYETRIAEKRSYYNDRRVIEIFKHDNTIKKLALEVQRL